MSGNQAELRDQTQQLLDGPLKHIRGAALAAALLPLASVAATPASAQAVCASGGVCGTVFNDTNHNGIQDDRRERPRKRPRDRDGQLCDGSSRISGTDDRRLLFHLRARRNRRTISAWSQRGRRRRLPTLGTTRSIATASIESAHGFSVATMAGNGTATDFGFFTQRRLLLWPARFRRRARSSVRLPGTSSTSRSARHRSPGCTRSSNPLASRPPQPQPCSSPTSRSC